MLGRADIRFKANGVQTARAGRVHFPIHLEVQRPTAVQALAEVSRVVEQLRRAVEAADLDEARLVVLDLDADDGQGIQQIVIEQKSQKEVRLRLTFTLALGLEGVGLFWRPMKAIAAVTDFLQNFALRPCEKGVEVEIQPAQMFQSERNFLGSGVVATS